MSFRFHNDVITLENYSRYFTACSPDVRDEIRSAVLDNTPIAPYIAPCGFDSYLLGQIRLALREGVPLDYLNVHWSGRTVYNIRQGVAAGRDMSGLLLYSDGQLDKKAVETLSEFIYLGADVSRVDFTKVPTDLVDIFCKGLFKGYPMWLLLDEGAHLTEGLVQILMRGLSLGVDIHPFIGGDWGNSVLMLLFSYGKTIDLNVALSYINSKFSLEQVKVVLDLMSSGVNIEKICVKDKTGCPVYNSYQMFELGESLRHHVFVEEMFNPALSDFEMAQMRKAVLEGGSFL